MADTKNWERRILHSMGSNFRIDVNNPQTSVGGNDVYNIYAATDENASCLMGLQQNGIWRLYNDGGIEIVGGQSSESSSVDVIIAGKNGDIVVQAEKNGRVRIRGKNVIIQADEDVDISAGRNVSIGSGSGRVLVKGNTLEKTGLKGNLLEPEANWAFRVFEGTGLPGFAFAELASPFSGITDLASSLASGGGNIFGDLVNNAVQGGLNAGLSAAQSAASSATGGLSDSFLNSGAGGLAKDAASKASGGISDRFL